MNPLERSRLLSILGSRCHAIADNWHKAIMRTSPVPLKATEVRQHLVELTEQAIAALLAEPFEQNLAEAIGALLARLGYVEPEALGLTQETLPPILAAALLPAEVCGTSGCRCARWVWQHWW